MILKNGLAIMCIMFIQIFKNILQVENIFKLNEILASSNNI